jgi:hypothetical protein
LYSHSASDSASASASASAVASFQNLKIEKELKGDV